MSPQPSASTADRETSPSVIDVTVVDGETFESVDPATGEQVGTLPGARRGRRAGRRRAGPAGRASGGPGSGSTAGPSGSAPGAATWPAGCRAGRAGAPGERQAARRRDPRDRPRDRPPRLGRRATRRGARPAPGPRRPAGGQPGRDRGVPAARRRRRDRPVELPGLHADGLDRLRAGRRQRRRLQAQRSTPRPSAGGWSTAFAEVVARARRCSRWSPALGETGAALCRAGVDKLAFTGSAATGKKVMAACAETLTPVLMECGGKDAMIVDDDADVDAAADAASGAR